MVEPSLVGGDPQRKGFVNGDISLVGGLSTKVGSPGAGLKKGREDLGVRE